MPRRGLSSCWRRRCSSGRPLDAGRLVHAAGSGRPTLRGNGCLSHLHCDCVGVVGGSQPVCAAGSECSGDRRGSGGRAAGGSAGRQGLRRCRPLDAGQLGGGSGLSRRRLESGSVRSVPCMLRQRQRRLVRDGNFCRIDCRLFVCSFDVCKGLQLRCFHAHPLKASAQKNALLQSPGHPC